MVVEEDLTKQKLDSSSRMKKYSQRKRKLSKNDKDDFQCHKKRKSDSSEDEMSYRKRPKSLRKSSVDQFKSVYDFPKVIITNQNNFIFSVTFMTPSYCNHCVP